MGLGIPSSYQAQLNVLPLIPNIDGMSGEEKPPEFLDLWGRIRFPWDSPGKLR